MKKSILGLCCGILALTAVISAQTPQSPTTSNPVMTTRQSSQTDVVTGCVAADTASEPGATESPVHSLERSVVDRRRNGQGRQTAATSYLLTNSDLNLGDHVGHKVQLTGYVDSSRREPFDPASPSMRVFHATSVRMLSHDLSVVDEATTDGRRSFTGRPAAGCAVMAQVPTGRAACRPDSRSIRTRYSTATWCSCPPASLAAPGSHHPGCPSSFGWIIVRSTRPAAESSISSYRPKTSTVRQL